VTLGPSDLAQELGVLGTPDQGRVIDEHRRRLIEAAARHGKQVAMLVQTLDEAERWIHAGVRLIAYASDVAVLSAGFAAAVRRLRPE
jgi:2-keto-3-deoxy-L-rhamnonate aldolase RhmA